VNHAIELTGWLIQMPGFDDMRRRMVEQYKREGYVKRREMADAMLNVPRELFMDQAYVEYAYYDQPFPIPGDGRQTISAPYMYPIFYEALGVRQGDRLLEIGTGSGYGAALARELVGSKGKVVTVEINEVTFEFAKANLTRAGYSDVIAVLGDGSLGFPEEAPYDKICLTATAPDIPPPLLEQLSAPGRLIAPVGQPSSLFGQDLRLLTREKDGKMKTMTIMQVVYVPLLGKHGWRER